MKKKKRIHTEKRILCYIHKKVHLILKNHVEQRTSHTYESERTISNPMKETGAYNNNSSDGDGNGNSSSSNTTSNISLVFTVCISFRSSLCFFLYSSLVHISAQALRCFHVYVCTQMCWCGRLVPFTWHTCMLAWFVCMYVYADA